MDGLVPGLDPPLGQPGRRLSDDGVVAGGDGGGDREANYCNNTVTSATERVVTGKNIHGQGMSGVSPHWIESNRILRLFLRKLARALWRILWFFD